MNDHDGGMRDEWSRYVRASLEIRPEGPPGGARAAERDVDLTLGTEHDGHISVSGYLACADASRAGAMFKVVMTTEEAARLADLLMFALADLPRVESPPASKD